MGITPSEARDLVAEYAARALTLDPDLAEGYVLRSVVSYLDLDLPAAEADVLRAIELEPGLAVAHARHGTILSTQQRNKEAFTRVGDVGVVLRFAFMYGPDDPLTEHLLDGVRRGWFPLFGSPDAYGSWIAHDDAAAAVVAALDVPAGTYNVVEDEPMRRRDLAGGLAQTLGVKPPRFLPGWMTALGGGVAATLARSLRISNRKLREASDWAPRYPTTLEGLRAIVGG